MFKKTIALIVCALLLLSVPVMAAPSDWAKSEVESAIKAGIVPEHLQTAYQIPITREEFCEMVMLFRQVLTKEEVTAEAAPFTDTDSAAVAAAYSLGIVQGESEEVFAPLNPVTRQEMCVMMQRALSSARPNLVWPAELPNTFPDAAVIADWAYSAVQNMNMFTVMLGDENGNINPLGNTTREQAILLVYRLLGTQSISMQAYVEKFLMPVNGNSHDNMLGGAFMVGTADGYIYLSGENGIRSTDGASVLTEDAAKAFTVFTESAYYVGADGAVYTVNVAGGSPKKLIDTVTDSFAAYSEKIYYKDLANNGRICVFDIATENTTVLLDRNGEVPAISGMGTFITDYNNIYKVGADGALTVIYSGANRELCIQKELLWFINGDGKLCTIAPDGSNYTERASVVINSYVFMRDEAVLQGTDDALYKIDYAGRYLIRFANGTFAGLCAYDDYVYGRTSDGAVYRLKTDATEKTRLN